MNNKNKLLFNDFCPVTKQQWADQATADLKGADFQKKLVWQNLSKIAIAPFYNSEDSQQFLKNTGQNVSSLINYRNILTDSAESGNQLALKAIEEGISGLLFEIKKPVPIANLLKGIDLSSITVSFVLKKNNIETAIDFIAFAEDNKVDSDKLTGYFDLEIIQNYATTGKIPAGSFDNLAKLVQLTEKYPNYKSVSISGGVFLDSGANQVQEVAYTLNALVFLIEKLTDRGIAVQTIFDQLHFELAIGSEYFVEIGKLRAFNTLLNEVAKKYAVSKFVHNLTAKTSVWSKTVTDANTNMLRATTETMSAILGNANGVLIDAFDKEYKQPSDFSSRIAGNIAIILQEESYFGKVSNPVDGSYYIEEVSSKIAQKALELFKGIEENGGFKAAFEQEIIQKQIAEICFEKIKLIRQRRLAMVGVNKYPNLMETVAADVLADTNISGTIETKVLKPRRAAKEIEALRKFTENLVEETKKRPSLELISYGNITMRKARAAFAYDFMGVSGFDILPEKSYENAKQAAETSAVSLSDVVIICSSDPDYDETALTFVESFRKLNKNKILLLAGNPIHLMDALTLAGLDDCLHMQSDIIQTISRVQQKLAKKTKPLQV